MDCAQSAPSIQGIWSPGSARETGFFAIDGPWTECPGDEADRKRATSTRTLGRFSAQGTPEGKVWSEAEELLSSTRSLAGSKRRQERRLGGALRGFPRTCVPDASLFGRPRRQLQRYSTIAENSCNPGHEYLRAVEKAPDQPTASPATVPAMRAPPPYPAADSMSRMALAMATTRSALRTCRFSISFASKRRARCSTINAKSGKGSKGEPSIAVRSPTALVSQLFRIRVDLAGSKEYPDRSKKMVQRCLFGLSL